MIWTTKNYPKQFDQLSPDIREEAIKIGNDLLKRGHKSESVIPIAIETAKDLFTFSYPAADTSI